ncbi:MAG: TetR/AcrR family transcriptional regulator [Flavobacteriales bacterium]|nr:TetR/AcrR family transcriptional regulator [Flavobacteriales bacterium]
MYTIISINLNENVFLKDPLSSELGNKIIRSGIDLLDEIGFENFTFKKLAVQIGSTEASIYRYFENKHKYLAYLTNWYWAWMDYRIMLSTLNISDPIKRLQNSIQLLTETVSEDIEFSHVNEIKLNRIVNAESSKVYLSKQVSTDNKEGYFKTYKNVVHKVADIILEIKPSYPFPHMLVSTIIEGSHHQRYFAEHLPKLTNVLPDKDSVLSFYTELTANELGIKFDPKV